MKLKKLTIILLINCLGLTYSQNDTLKIQDNNSYKFSSEKYITDSDGNIRMNVNIWGHVAQPGSHLVFEGIDLATLLSKVGGPNIGANLRKVKLIREFPDKDGKLVSTINFNHFLLSGDRSNFKKIKPNDTIIIPQKLSSVLLNRASSISIILGLINLFIQINNLI